MNVLEQKVEDYIEEIKREIKTLETAEDKHESYVIYRVEILEEIVDRLEEILEK